jgi:hypothetical protein
VWEKGSVQFWEIQTISADGSESVVVLENTDDDDDDGVCDHIEHRCLRDRLEVAFGPKQTMNNEVNLGPT